MVFPVSGAICWRGFFAFDSCLYLFLCFTVSLLVCVFVTQADFATLGAGRGEGLGEVGRDQGILLFLLLCVFVLWFSLLWKLGAIEAVLCGGLLCSSSRATKMPAATISA